MSLMENINPLEKKKINWHRVGLYIAGLFCIIVIGFSVSVVSYLYAYEGKVYPGVYIGSEYVGEKSFDEVKYLLEDYNNKIFNDGLSIVLPESNKVINLDLSDNVSPDNIVELVKIDTDATTKQILQIGRNGNWRENILIPIYYRLTGRQINAVVIMNEKAVVKNLQDKMLPHAIAPNDANVKIVLINPLQFEIIKEKTGHIFDYMQLVNAIADNLSVLSSQPVAAKEQVVTSAVKETDLPNVSEELPNVLSYGDLGFNYVDGKTKARNDWNVTKEEYANWLEVQKDGDKFIFGLNKEAVQKYLENLRIIVDIPAEDAKFTIENGKVKEFQGNKTGLAINSDKTYEELNKIFRERNYHPAVVAKTVSLVVEVVEPQTKLADINELGVTDIIGVGESTFYGSHANRIKNITNAVSRLNGLIIMAGEEFSTIKAAGPFTIENGYLPELVIKGDKITREVGGGMCQIGTTLFHMAMNSGMPIVERRNHSLVVNYYLDPVNNKPGTDATVYDPVVDFKFLNDTGNYLLLQTAVDYKAQKLTFTLWGNPDGRKGSYTHPIVSRWMSAGETKTIEVDNLKPGVKECQGAYRGAVASFIYTRYTPTGEEIKTVFDSYYRPLADICRVGKQPDSTCPVGKSCPVVVDVPALDAIGVE